MILYARTTAAVTLACALMIIGVTAPASHGVEATTPGASDGGDVYARDIEVLLPDGPAPLTANVRVGDLVGDGSPQIFVTEPLSGRIAWLRGRNDTVFLTTGLIQPVRTQAVDLDGDTYRDLLVADIGQILPTEDKVGRVVLLRNDGAFGFEPLVLLENVGRVACAEAADLDGDGDLDIAVCVFGDLEGKILWLEQREGFVFVEHIVDERPGAIHAFPFDADGDGDMDLAVSLSQDSEEVLLFRNDGGGGFTREVLFKAGAYYYGMSGIELADLDRDGDMDVLVTNGDEGDGPLPNGLDPYEVHGLAWLENDGSGRFTHHEMARHWGAYSVRAVDVDADLDLDLVLSALQSPGRYDDAPLRGLVWLENDGSQNFTRHTVLDAPSLLITIDVIDIDGDGVPEVLGGSFNECSIAVLQSQSAEPSADRECSPVGHRLAMFSIDVGAGPAAEVPGLSQWGLAAFFALLLLTYTWRTRHETG